MNGRKEDAGETVNGKITYSRTPETWSQEEFLRLGGFTVVFLNYNKARYIEKSVASALGQDFPLCEMFFMDDASTDGSGDTMEQLVRAYRGRHKVTVVRNDENQHICGQWNIVSKLATGVWYGMFCADDVAHPDRVSVAAEIAAENITLKGFCTNYNQIVVLEDVANFCQNNSQRMASSGDASFDELVFPVQPVIGATAWWHRTLFRFDLPKGPLDDVILRMVLQSMYRDVREPIWMWAGDKATVDYSVGNGISTVGTIQHVSQRTPVENWIACTLGNRKFSAVAYDTWKGVLRYYSEHGAGKGMISIAKYALLSYQWNMANTFKRVSLFVPLGGLLLRPGVRVGFRIRYLTSLITIFLKEFFGLHFAAFISTRFLHPNLWRSK